MYFNSTVSPVFPSILISYQCGFKLTQAPHPFCLFWASKPCWAFTILSCHLSRDSRFSILFWKLLSLPIYSRGKHSSQPLNIELITMFHNSLIMTLVNLCWISLPRPGYSALNSVNFFDDCFRFFTFDSLSIRSQNFL